MRLDKLRILNFRNYKDIEVGSFGRINLLAGENGSGKTNFLESIQTLLRLHPIRAASFGDLIRWDSNSFYISGTINGDLLEYGFSKEKKILKFNGNFIKPKDYSLKYPVVSFIPEDISIVTGNPEIRRTYFDHILSSMDIEYRFSLQRYQRVLKERNAQIRLSAGEVSIWNHELIVNGSRLIEKRLELIRFLNIRLKELYYDLYNQELDIKYLNTFRIENSITDSFEAALKTSLRSELEKGCTLIGPHRDNFEIFNVDKKAKNFASQGQRRSIALALKLCIIEMTEKYFHDKPILLLDDVLLELDSIRRDKILEFIIPGHQIFLTSTDTGFGKNIININSVISPPVDIKHFIIKNGLLEN